MPSIMTKNTRSKAKKGSTGCFRGIILVMWKNFQYRKKCCCCCLTCCEILAPALIILLQFLFIFMWLNIGGMRGGGGGGGGGTSSLSGSQLVFKSFSIRDLKGRFIPCKRSPCDLTLAFYPPEAREIIDKLVAELKAAGEDFQPKPYDSEEDLEAFVAETFLKNDRMETNFIYVAAIIFTKGFPLSTSGQGDSQISYKIRLPVEKHTDIETHELYPVHEGPFDFGSKTSGIRDNWYIHSGFVLFQLILDNLLLQDVKLNPVGKKIPNVVIQEYSISDNLWKKEMDSFRLMMSYTSAFYLVSGFMIMVFSIITIVVSEKKSGIKELMKIMGLPNWIHWLGWMLNFMIPYIISVTLLVIVLHFVPYMPGGDAVFGHSNLIVLWVSLYLYALSSIAFCLFISSLFPTPITGVVVGLLAWIVTYFTTALTVSPNDHQKYGLAEILALALLPNYGFQLFLTLTIRYEGQAIGVQWSNIAEPMNSEMKLSLVYVWVMFLADTILYSLLAVYLENVLPSEFGIRKPWYYPFWSSCCNKLRLPSFRRKRRPQFEQVINADPQNTTEFEAEPTGLNAGIIVTNLTKQFGWKRKVVNNLSFKMFDGQITALLGHNGAGKTTTMSILTGMLAPTIGTATVNGFDIRTQMDKVRSSISLCPQHNLLFERLSVRENLIFFGRLKGLSPKEADKETTSLLQLVGMPEKAKVLAKKLSGGQKRKLCLCMALIGGSKVLILDEPTSGMDPDARRAIWDVLLAMRGSRTILLSTHFMDEADVLGDRIAIMAAGKLQCCGSPEYLKRFYGAGFTLSMTIDPKADKNAIMALVQKHSPEASWKYKKFSTDSELGIILPTKAKGGSKSEFSPLLSDLGKKKQDLRINSIGLTMTTMDDVFVKVGELLEGEGAETSAMPSGGESAPKSKGCCLVLLRFWALFLKRVLYAWRKKMLFLAQFGVPMLLLLIIVLIVNSKLVVNKNSPKLTMKLSDYKNPITLYTPADDWGKTYKGLVDPSGKFVQSVSEELTKAHAEDAGTFQAKYVVAADLNKPDPTSTADPTVTAFYSSFALHAAPLSINLVSNAILKSYITDGNIEVSNQPIVNEIAALTKLESNKLKNADFVSILSEGMYDQFLQIGFLVFAGFMIVYPLDEKMCKQLQVMTGVNPLIFWLSSFLWDLIVLLILAGLTVLVLLLHRKDVFAAYDAGGVIFLIVLVFGLTVIAYAYVCSLYLKTPAKGFIFIVLVNFVGMQGVGTISGMLAFGEMLGIGKVVSVISRILGWPFPIIAFGRTIKIYREIVDKNAECDFIPEKFQKAVCKIKGTDEPVYKELYHCCHTCEPSFLKSVPNGPWPTPYSGTTDDTGCHVPIPFFSWTHLTTNSITQKIDTVPGIPQELLQISLLGLVCTLILIAMEFGILGRMKSKAAKGQHNRPSTDEDVIVESQRVQEMVASGQVGQDAFVAGDISKSYGGFAAVSNLSFGVHHGECFGLLGVNGAGKTTAFRILTGDEVSSGGDAYAFNLTLKKNKRKFLRNIGYCPQFDGIIEVLTGREMLELFARLRGIQGKYVNSQATLWLKKTGLYASRNQLCKTYSGGMKRRLSAGIALIGEPRIIMLDEPTSGVDPMARLRFWDILAEARNSGQSVILTSHSMEECEALCTRLGIMVNGQLQCFGDVDHLKSKFAQGFNLVLKLKPLVPPESPELLVLNEEILKKFEPCELKDQHQNVLQYQITNKTIGWNDLFNQMEDIKTRNEALIEEYSVNETTLEDVFLVLARQQYPERIVPASCFNKCISLDCC